jgi:hypothetical protein
MSHLEDAYDTYTEDFNENDDNTPILSKSELITLTLNERQDITNYMFNILCNRIETNSINFMRYMNFRNFTEWFIDHLESDIIDY